jgi:methionyl-tRNA formyltransferase (EC 2.1.2.9)
MRVVFAGTPEFAAVAFEALLMVPELSPVAVLTQPDRPAGRGLKLMPSAVKQRALAAGIPIQQPPSLREEAVQQALAALEPDILVVAAYGLILPQAVLDIPRFGCLNIHASLLPRWRGAAPIQRAILAGDRETGVAIMLMEAGLDTGPVLAERRTEIGSRETAGSLHDRLARLGAEALIEVLQAYAAGRPPAAQPQPADGVSYAHKITAEETRIDWTQNVIQIDRQIRAFDPTPGAWTTWRGETLKIWAAEPSPGFAPSEAVPGTVLQAERDVLLLATGCKQPLAIHALQRAGSRKLTTEAWLAGAKIGVGEKFQ